MIEKTANNPTKPAKTRQKITYKPAPLPEEGFVRLPSVLAVLQISKTSFYNGIKDGRYPPGKLLTPKTRVWDVKQIRKMLEEIGKAEQ